MLTTKEIRRLSFYLTSDTLFETVASGPIKNGETYCV